MQVRLFGEPLAWAPRAAHLASKAATVQQTGWWRTQPGLQEEQGSGVPTTLDGEPQGGHATQHMAQGTQAGMPRDPDYSASYFHTHFYPWGAVHRQPPQQLRALRTEPPVYRNLGESWGLWKFMGPLVNPD